LAPLERGRRTPETRIVNETVDIYTRRTVIKNLASVAAGVALGANSGICRAPFSVGDEFISKRLSPGQRKFVSDAVEAKIVEVKKGIADPELAWLFENCFPNTLDTTLTFGT